MSPAFASFFTMFAALITAMSVGGARSAMRVAVLTADGLSVRLYAYAPLMLGGMSAPVTVPIRLLDTAGESVRRPFTGADASTVHVSVGQAPLHITFDKPAAVMQWVGG